MQTYPSLRLALLLLSGLLGSLGHFATAQESQQVAPIVCYAGENHATPHPYRPIMAKTTQARSDFNISYTNTVPGQAQLALAYAALIWENILASDVPINVEVTWDTLANNILASSGPTRIYRNFPGAGTDHWYPVALAEALRGFPFNGDEADMTLTINGAINWYYGADQQPGPNQYDFVMVVVHELAHGLGMFSPASTTGDTAELGIEARPLIYEAFLWQSDSIYLTDTATYANPSPGLFDAVTSDDLFYDCPEAIDISGAPLKVHAPNTFRRGSSLAHLDETSYTGSSPHTLMTPNISVQEANYNPEELTLCIFEQMGWDVEALLTLPVSVAEAEAMALRLYPNPVRLWLRLAGSLPGTRYCIVDMQGKTCLQGRYTGTPIAVASLPPGYYVFETYTPQGRPLHLPFTRQ